MKYEQPTSSIALDPHRTFPSDAGLATPRLNAPQDFKIRLSAYDPRAVGGRQVVRLSLPIHFAHHYEELELRVRCDLLPLKVSQYRFIRALNREWQSVLLSFSSRDKEHGQYPLELELRAHAFDAQHDSNLSCRQRWLSHSILFLPRSNASLSEIHQVFLHSQKNVRVIAEDGAIARVQHGATASAQTQLDVVARDGALAQVHIETDRSNGIQESSPGYLAWDEALVEVAVQVKVATQNQADGPAEVEVTPSRASNLSHASTHERAAPRGPLEMHSEKKLAVEKLACRVDYHHRIRHHHLSVIAAEQWRFGRTSSSDPTSTPTLEKQIQDIVLEHPRISAVHAEILCQQEQFFIRDHSRFGVSVQGQRLVKAQPHVLGVGDRLDFCASFPGQLEWQVVALFDSLNTTLDTTLHHKQACLLRRQNEHGAFEHLCLVHAPSLSPSTLLQIGQLCQQLYATPSHAHFVNTLPPKQHWLTSPSSEWQVEPIPPASSSLSAAK
ncbi:FHA domain-containing protein [Undibacterium cyanobacteriorum]|uniref:FHA domain-containing protein n=1 Tax=Undibacterium cyanobacteriorum TaxID=3073561 RepID=A0ABY9RHY0_9BURK|nr:FHA domain-containing protein [Undibacterium sp. 20NA77.5]WMW80810.1 FHA domain-containing protein [Undibacterium sp. 20NA77.5]